MSKSKLFPREISCEILCSQLPVPIFGYGVK